MLLQDVRKYLLEFYLIVIYFFISAIPRTLSKQSENLSEIFLLPSVFPEAHPTSVSFSGKI